MNLAQVALLALIQGMAELLPVSSSAHVVVAEKLMGLDPSSPEMTFLLVALHTGTMFAVLLYFWPRWKVRWTASGKETIKCLVVATGCTGVVGLALKKVIEKTQLHGAPKAEIEALFSNMPLVAGALACAGVLIIIAGRRDGESGGADVISSSSAGLIGAVQGLCLPFRGFSRSGATISTGLLLRIPRALAEDFSFALAVILTPPVVAREVLRLIKAAGGLGFLTPSLFVPGFLGMIFSFAAGLGALRWLSAWLEKGRWSYFGWYCLGACAAMVAALSLHVL